MNNQSSGNHYLLESFFFFFPHFSFLEIVLVLFLSFSLSLSLSLSLLIFFFLFKMYLYYMYVCVLFSSSTFLYCFNRECSSRRSSLLLFFFFCFFFFLSISRKKPKWNGAEWELEECLFLLQKKNLDQTPITAFISFSFFPFLFNIFDKYAFIWYQPKGCPVLFFHPL